MRLLSTTTEYAAFQDMATDSHGALAYLPLPTATAAAGQSHAGDRSSALSVHDLTRGGGGHGGGAAVAGGDLGIGDMPVLKQLYASPAGDRVVDPRCVPVREIGLSCE